MTTERNVATITEFVAAWSRLDPDELADYFSEDGCYHNIPVGPVVGRDNVRAMIAAFTADWTATQWDLINIVGAGDVVIAERLDRTDARGGGWCILPLQHVAAFDVLPDCA